MASRDSPAIKMRESRGSESGISTVVLTPWTFDRRCEKVLACDKTCERLQSQISSHAMSDRDEPGDPVGTQLSNARIIAVLLRTVPYSNLKSSLLCFADLEMLRGVLHDPISIRSIGNTLIIEPQSLSPFKKHDVERLARRDCFSLFNPANYMDI